MDCSTSVMFTRSQLAKLHKQFFHPSAEKLFNLLRRARPEEATPETLIVLQDLTKRCDPCQRIQTAPIRFRVSFGAENVRFNERILLDVVTIDGKPVLHIADEGTRFSAAQFLPDVSTKTIWSTILECWAMIYSGLPNRMLVDQGSYFGNLFINLGAISNVEVQSTGIEAHSSLGLGERYHQPLRNTYRKIMHDHPQTSPKMALAASVKAMNDTLGPEGLVPSALVFGEFPRVNTRSETRAQRATLEQRAAIALSARKEMEKHMSDMRVRRALKHKTPSAADKFYQPGEQVLVWREKIVNHHIGEWLGPFTIIAVDESKKQVFVQDVKIGSARPFNIVQVKRYYAPEMIAHCFMSEIQEKLSTFGSSSSQDSEVFLTEILSLDDPRASSPEKDAAMNAEIISASRWTSYTCNSPLIRNVPCKTATTKTKHQSTFRIHM